MKKLLFAILALMLIVTSANVLAIQQAEAQFTNNGFEQECKNFYGNDDYFTIEKWSFNRAYGDFRLDEQSKLYGYYEIFVTGDFQDANWTSHRNFKSVLVKAGDKTVAYDDMTPANIFLFGGWMGSVASEQDISHITFCGKRSSNSNTCFGDGCNDEPQGVPEFPSLALGAALILGTLSIVVLRKN